MRAFTKFKEMILGYDELKNKIDEMENKYNHQFKIIFDAIKKMLEYPAKPIRTIGFRTRNEEE